MAALHEPPSTIRILAVDDDMTVLEMAKLAAAESGSVELCLASSAAEAFAALADGTFDAIFLDLDLGDRSGTDVLSRIIAEGRGALVIVITGDERAATIVDCVKRGAFDYVAKPISPARLMTIITHVRSILELKREIQELGGGGANAARDPVFAPIITRSPLMLELFTTMKRVARSPLAVLIAGESGVGKELIARAIYGLSKQSGSFVPVNVAGLDDNLFADTLFGHIKGAYTGAEGKRRGLVREADDGTLFLDEIGDLGPEAQVKLLRFIQDGEFYPLGADKPDRSSARLVLATNADLHAKMRQGSFRADLYYRLTIHYIAVPPLRERREDIPLLVAKFAKDAAAALGRPVPRRLDGFIAAIEEWSFPGNIRELFALVHSAMSWSEGGTLPAAYALDYVRSMREKPVGNDSGCQEPREQALSGEGPFPTLEELTDRHIREALRRSGGNQSLAARMLGISQSTISRRFGADSMKKT